MAETEIGRPIYRECRACLKIGDSSGFVNIFLSNDPPWCWKKDTTIAEELTRVAQVQVSNTDKCSDVLCFSCCFKLHNSSIFIAMVQESETIIKARLQNESTNAKIWPKPIQLETEISEEVLGNVPEHEIKQEVLSEEENLSDSIDGDDMPELQMEIKVEPEEIVQSRPIQVTVNGTISDDQMKKMSNGGERYYDEEYLTEYIKDEPISDEENSGLFDLPLDCMLCAKKFLSVSGLKAHVVACHSYKSVRRRTGSDRSPVKRRKRHICPICRRCFWTLTDLMVHETCHNKFHCYGCQMIFDSFGALLKHRQRCIASNTQKYQVKTLEDAMRSSATKVFVRKSLNTCTECDEEFTDEYYKNVHNEVHHSSLNIETDKDKVVCDRNENISGPAEEKDKINENMSLTAEEKDKQNMNSPAEEKDKRKENISVQTEDKRKATEIVEEEKDSNRMETESLELEMQKDHEETNRASSNKKESKENNENPNIGQDNETANESIAIDESLNNLEDPGKVKQTLIDVNVKITGSNNLEGTIECCKKIKQEPDTIDDEPNSETNSLDNGDTSKLASTGPAVGQRNNVIKIENDTVRNFKSNIKEDLDNTFSCTMMRMDSY